MIWERNTGQFTADVAAVADLEFLEGEYSGAGVVRLSRNLKSFEYDRNRDISLAGVLDAERETEEPHGMASGHKIIIFHGTAAAALLAVLGN